MVPAGCAPSCWETAHELDTRGGPGRGDRVPVVRPARADLHGALVQAQGEGEGGRSLLGRGLPAVVPSAGEQVLGDGAQGVELGVCRLGVGHGVVGLAQLNERSRDIFRQIVESYLATGEPVGSRTLLERMLLDVSPSTVRSELAELESLSLIVPSTPPV